MARRKKIPAQRKKKVVRRKKVLKEGMTIELPPRPLPKPNLKKKVPDYVIQIGDPKLLRKDLLESLREIIIFMQGYEKFKRIQEEKIATFARMKTRIKELERLIEVKLKGHLPRGKLKPITEVVKPRAIPARKPEIVAMPQAGAPGMSPTGAQQVAPQMPPAAAPVREQQQMPAPQAAPGPLPQTQQPARELDALERQLKEIEDQLKNV